MTMCQINQKEEREREKEENRRGEKRDEKGREMDIIFGANFLYWINRHRYIQEVLIQKWNAHLHTYNIRLI